MARAEAAALVTDLRAAPKSDTASLRDIRRYHSRRWRKRPAAFVIDVARRIAEQKAHRWIAYELVRFHRSAFSSLTDEIVAGFAEGLDSWDNVDAFGRTLSGPAWAHGFISDSLTERWAGSPDRWLRRAALVSTIELRDTARALRICARLAPDHDDMVEKALSWALRERSKKDSAAVEAFLNAHAAELGARVKREVRNKLRTGLKNPRRSKP